jgi:hypothetical protein
MGSRDEVWNLLQSREGDWISRADIDFVGGAEATRRLRELRTFVAGHGMSIENRMTHDEQGRRREEYRLTRYAQPDPVTGRWACTKCGAPPTGVTTNSMDPRWRLGVCYPCKNKRATFERLPT